MEQWLAAWGEWLHGEKLRDCFLIWGHTIVWWNRLGQVFQFVSAIIVISEIIGKEKLCIYGEWLKYVSATIAVFIAFSFHAVFVWIYGFMFVTLNFLLVFCGFDFFKEVVWNKYEGIILYIGVLILSICGISITFYVLSGLFFLISKIMTSNNGDKAFKIFALIFWLVGFHFNLLAS